MRILIIIQGDYGRRFLENISKHSPSTWIIDHYEFPINIPVMFDEPLEKHIPKELHFCDLLLMLQENPVVAEMTTKIAELTGAKAVIAPIDNKAYLPSGLARQIKSKLAQKGIDMVFPMTFCTLTNKESDNKFITEFSQFFGKPKLTIELENEKVSEVGIMCEAPCGNTRFVAQHLIGIHKKDAVEQSGLLHHQHPCLATMVMDREIGDTLMHHSGLMTKLAVEEALSKIGGKF